ncbi:MAG: SDR family NAD(P)-dependent oxidoreductase, partial [Arenicellales bacterium]|nr:SDR family NAD(P)-dependent oxidoreductase [Arenicellales bacterium]
MNLNNETALVTGAASGMGAATAEALAARGARVAILDINEAAAKTAAGKLGGVGIGCDVSNADSAAAALDEAVEALGAPRVVVSCAGIALASRIVGREGPHDLAAYQQVINVNL